MRKDRNEPSAPRQLFGAADVAAFCQVDLKTIHNWAERGEVLHFRTPGGHLRFQRIEVLDLLRTYGYPLPEELRHPRPRVVVWETDADGASTLRRSLSKRFEVDTFTDGLEALVALGRSAPDAFVLDTGGGGVDGLNAIERLRLLEPTRHVRSVVYSAREELRDRAASAGAYAFVRKGDAVGLRRTLVRLLGLEQG